MNFRERLRDVVARFAAEREGLIAATCRRYEAGRQDGAYHAAVSGPSSAFGAVGGLAV